MYMIGKWVIRTLLYLCIDWFCIYAIWVRSRYIYAMYV